MTTPRTKTHQMIASVLAEGSLTGPQISNRAGVPWMGVESALRGMLKRGEVARLSPLQGESAYRYRLRASA